MCGDYSIVEKADAVQIIDGTGAFRFDAIVHLALRFRDVCHDGRAGAIRKRANGSQMFFRDSVGRVWRNRGND